MEHFSNFLYGVLSLNTSSNILQSLNRTLVLIASEKTACMLLSSLAIELTKMYLC